MAYETIPPSVGASSIAIVGGDGLTGDGSAGTPLGLVPASELTAGSLSIADFNKLATVPTGATIAVAVDGETMDLVGGAGLFYQVIPACPFKLINFQIPRAEMVTVGGTRSVVAAGSCGSNANADDFAVISNNNGATLTQAAATISSFFGSTIAPAPVLDLTTNGLRYKVTTAMTGTAPVCTVRINGFAILRHT